MAGDEDAIHCHGVAWAADDNDPISRMRFNNLFFVSMFDHMYQRGYVGDISAPANDAAIPMCGCIEEMPIVSRSDCTQIDATLTVTLGMNEENQLTAVPEDDLEINFNSCQASTNNDLAAYVKKLVRQKKMEADMGDFIGTVIVGTCPA